MSEVVRAEPGQRPPQPRLREVLSPKVVLILGTILVSTVALYMVQPFFVIYFHEKLGFSTAEAGSLVGLPFLVGVPFGLFGGYLSDRFGIARAYVLATIVYTTCIVSVAFVHSFVYVAALMLMSGLMAPVMGAGISGLLNLSAPFEYRGVVQTYSYWMANVGGVLGLLVAADLLEAGSSTRPFLVVGAIRLMICVTVAVVFMGRTAPVPAKPATARPTMLETFRLAAFDRALLFAALTTLLLIVLESQLNVTVPLYFAGHFHHGIALFGPVLAINALVVVVFQPLAMKWFTKSRSARVFTVGALCMGMGLAVGGMGGTLTAWIIGMVLYSIGEVLASIKLQPMYGALPQEENTALYFSVIASAQNLAMFLGLALGGVVYALAGSSLFSGMAIVGALAALVFSLATRAFVARSRNPDQETAAVAGP